MDLFALYVEANMLFGIVVKKGEDARTASVPETQLTGKSGGHQDQPHFLISFGNSNEQRIT